MGYPSVYPTGVTVYLPEKAFNGYTLFQAPSLGAILIDMNGREKQLWKGLQGFPNKLLPGGIVFGSTGERNPKYGYQDQRDLVQVDWHGNINWRFSRTEFIADPGEEPQWFARQHHDFQREGNPVGYYVPGQEPLVDRGNTFLLVHENVTNPDISEHQLLDDKIIEVTWDGNIVWEWRANEHFQELGFDEAAKRTLRRNPNTLKLGGNNSDGKVSGDWLHLNSLSLIGPNRWYDAGDERFHPDNLIWDAREANIIAIISKQTGEVVWRLGPNYDATEQEKAIGWIIGQHHAHIIPRGLPGEGNLLVFDNGGWAGYGDPNPGSADGTKNALRDYSRILEIDPISLQIVWQYTPKEAGLSHPLDSTRFYSPFISSAQRLPNGNTLITEGSDGRIFEVTAEHELVWEYISPFKGQGSVINFNMVYRAYRYPYSYVPQLEQPVETPIHRIDPATFRLPGAAEPGQERVIDVAGVKPYQKDAEFCVVSDLSRNVSNAN